MMQATVPAEETRAQEDQAEEGREQEEIQADQAQAAEGQEQGGAQPAEEETWWTRRARHRAFLTRLDQETAMSLAREPVSYSDVYFNCFLTPSIFSMLNCLTAMFFMSYTWRPGLNKSHVSSEVMLSVLLGFLFFNTLSLLGNVPGRIAEIINRDGHMQQKRLVLILRDAMYIFGQIPEVALGYGIAKGLKWISHTSFKEAMLISLFGAASFCGVMLVFIPLYALRKRLGEECRIYSLDRALRADSRERAAAPPVRHQAPAGGGNRLALVVGEARPAHHVDHGLGDDIEHALRFIPHARVTVQPQASASAGAQPSAPEGVVERANPLLANNRNASPWAVAIEVPQTGQAQVMAEGHGQPPAATRLA